MITFREQARMCTTRDIFFSQLPAGGTGRDAWVYPYFVGGNGVGLDFIGFNDSPNKLTCEVWMNQSGDRDGLILTAAGGLWREADCDKFLPLACCKVTGSSP